MIDILRRGPKYLVTFTERDEVLWSGSPDMLLEEWHELPWLESVDWSTDGLSMTMVEGREITIQTSARGTWMWRVSFILSLVGLALLVTWLITRGFAG